MGSSRLPALGPRGEGWVALQLAAIAAVGIAGVWGPAWTAGGRSWSLAGGLLSAAIGGALAWSGIRSLGPSLTALPRPGEGSALRETGVYARARHPIYGGVLLVSLGFVLITSPWAVVPWVLLTGILVAKSTREERWLIERYEGYVAYRTRVPRRFVPYLF